MRILIEGTTYHPALNGQAVFMVNLAEGLVRRGHEVTVMYPELRDSSHARNGVRLEPVRSISLGSIHNESYAPFFFTRRVQRVFDTFRPDIVHIHDHYPLSWGVVAEAKRRRVPVIGTNHFGPASLEPYIPGSSVFKPLLDKLLWNWMLSLFRQLDFVTAPSPAAVKVLRQLGLKVAAEAVSCGTDLARFHPDAKVDRTARRAQYGLDVQGMLFLYVGRVDREKRIDVLLHAMALLKRDDIQLGIAGQGAALHELQSLAERLHLRHRVRFTGQVENEDLPDFLNSADVFAMAGEAESLSIASLEAMACGLPVLLADAFALPELVTQGVNGYLFKSGDPGDAARYMGLLADQRGKWPAMGRASLERVEPHSLEYTLQRYETLYAQTMETAARPAGAAAAQIRTRKTKIVKREL